MDSRHRNCLLNCDIRGIPLHRFPNPDKKPDLFVEWCAIVGIDESNPMQTYLNKRICHRHFITEQKSPTSWRRIIHSARPTLHLQGVRRSLLTIIEEEHDYCSRVARLLDCVPPIPVEHNIVPVRPEMRVSGLIQADDDDYDYGDDIVPVSKLDEIESHPTTPLATTMPIKDELINMELYGHSFLDKVLGIVKDSTDEEVPMIQFRHPKELEKILDLDVSEGVSDNALERCVRHVLQYSVKTNKAVFRNQLYGGTDPYGLAGAWIAEAFNTSQYTYEVAPVFTLIELKMLRHILKLFGIPGGDGIFSPGGSISMLYGLVAARYKRFPQVKTKGMRGLPELVIFTSEDSHYSIRKAAHWLGFGTDSIRLIKTNDQGQMLIQELDRAIREEINIGRYPLMVNGTAGTTVLGAIDDLEEIADVCKKYRVLMYVDACWGGSLMLSNYFRSRLKGIERADFISWNPHKMAGAPLQCSVFLARYKGLLHEANCAAAQYLFQQDKFYDVSYDQGDKSIQCGRKIDAFKLWMMWKARGDHGLSALTDRVMEIAEFCIEVAAVRPGFRLVTAPIQCPNVCFWYIPSFMRDVEEDKDWWDLMHKITPKIKELLTLSSQLMVAYSPLRQHKNFFRLAFTFHPKIHEKDVVEMLQAIEDCGEQITIDMLQ